MPTLRASTGGEGCGVITKSGGRRLTIEEWERLQGFPVGWTAGCGTEGERRRALGNSFPPPMLRWIAGRMEAQLKFKTAAEAPSSQILTLQKISSSLARITAVDEAKALRDKTEALRVYFQTQTNCDDIIKQTTAVRLRCERRIGELLSATVKRGSKCKPDSHIPEGISRAQSSAWQAVAKVPEKTFNAYLESRSKISTKGVLQFSSKAAAVEPIELVVERGLNRLRAQIADRLGCTVDSKRVDNVLAKALAGRRKLA